MFEKLNLKRNRNRFKMMYGNFIFLRITYASKRILRDYLEIPIDHL